MIYCIWYPSGGFGHFVNAIISLYGKNFCRPKKNLSLGKDGNSHSVPLSIPKFTNKNKELYRLPITDPHQNYSVLIDNGINDESLGFLDYLPGSTPIKICYDDHSWPVVAYTHIIKAMRSDLDKEAKVDASLWPENSNWAQREKFFLYLRDHDLRHQWRPNEAFKSLMIEQFICYDSMYQGLQEIGIALANFKSDWHQWWSANHLYFSPVLTAKTIIANITQNSNQNLTHITDSWTQAVIYYFIWLHFKREVPHNDFANFFVDTDQIRKWLKI